MAETVKCADCGFLAVQRYQHRDLLEVEDHFRRSGEPPYAIDDDLVNPVPVCLQFAWDIRHEVRLQRVQRDGEGSVVAPEDVEPVIGLERECNAFTPWRQGFSPKKHPEMIDREELRESAQRREQADRDWGERVEKRNQRYRIIELSIVGAAAVLTAAAILLAAFIPLFLR